MEAISKGFLGQLFEGVVAKRLTLVETITEKSNQHEFQGTKLLRSVFGTEDRREIPTKYIWIEGEQAALIADGFISWSNVRKNKPRAAEYHLYYSTNVVTQMMKVGHTAFIALRPENEALVVIVSSDSQMLGKLFWLFGINESEQLRLDLGAASGAATFRNYSNDADAELDFAARFILDELGIEFELPEAQWIDSLLEKYPAELPSTKEFASFARETCRTLNSAAHEPDLVVMAWLDHEEKLFRRHEHNFLAERLNRGFILDGKPDVEGFKELAKSVGNKRMSRMGHSLESHLAAVFHASNIRFSHGATTERTSKPDFIFPGIGEYKNASFEQQRLTMLASKSSLKDRWRQVTTEADRISIKHVFTLEQAISIAQTNEMKHQQVQLVVPRGLHRTYREEQQKWLWDLSKFIELVRTRQSDG